MADFGRAEFAFKGWNINVEWGVQDNTLIWNIYFGTLVALIVG
jgi:hypothetical protein